MKHRNFYPFLLVLYIIITPLSNNLDQLDPAQALRPAVVLLILAAAGIFLVYAITRDWQYASFLVFLITLFFFSYGHLVRLLQTASPAQVMERWQPVTLIVWALLLLALGSRRVGARLAHLSGMTTFLNLMCLIALAGPVFSISRQSLPRISPHPVAARSIQQLPGGGTLDCSFTPDIYYIILDGYGRSDVLAERYGIDNQPFLDYLRGKGFYVADESHSNYMQTIFSIASGLNLSYIDPPQGLQNDARYFKNRIERNTLRTWLESCGYLFVTTQSGFYFTDDLAPDAVLTPGVELNEFESLLLSGSPVEVIAKRLDLGATQQSYAAHRQQVKDSFRALKEAPQLDGPKLVFAHIISPHPPFVFDEGGKALEPGYPYSLADGDEYPGTVNEYLAGYADQVSYASREMQRVVDTLLAHSETPPLIIIQGDHGPGSGLDWGSPYNSCLWERTSILNAYYLPGIQPGELYPSISPVNSFRVVLNEYFGADLPLLPDNTFFTSHRMRRQVLDITPLRSSRDNCEVPPQ